MRLPTARIRSVAIIVAIAAMAPWSVVMWQRSKHYARLAYDHEGMAAAYEVGLSSRIGAAGPAVYKSNDYSKLSETELWAVMEMKREGRLARKCRRAARYPWLYVDPDPPMAVAPRSRISGTPGL